MAPAHPIPSSDIAFTASVKAIQEQRGSRTEFTEQEEQGGWATRITPVLADFIASVRTCFLATATASGQPYVQHRGGPPGFLRVLDAQTLALADFTGNRQYLTTGNLAENPRAFLFLIDYARRRRIKLWGSARTVENDPDLLRRLSLDSYPAEAEQAIVFTLEAWDMNCPRHIPVLVPETDVRALCQSFESRIAALESEKAELLRRLGGTGQ
ncbi:MAG: pyridoxamine 5'-phosphate oxidase family protein [Rhodoferax sp.]